MDNDIKGKIEDLYKYHKTLLKTLERQKEKELDIINVLIELNPELKEK